MSCKIHWECEDEPCPYCEIDRLNKCLFQAQNAAIDLERQLDASQALLAEARAENERLNSVDHYACTLCPDVKQARQEAARSILQIISMETIDRPFEQSQAVEIIRQRYILGR